MASKGIDFRARFKGRYVLGDMRYHAGTGPDECRVYTGGAVWVFRSIPEGDRKEFRMWAKREYTTLVTKITGSYPTYRVVMK